MDKTNTLLPQNRDGRRTLETQRALRPELNGRHILCRISPVEIYMQKHRIFPYTNVYSQLNWKHSLFILKLSTLILHTKPSALPCLLQLLKASTRKRWQTSSTTNEDTEAQRPEACPRHQTRRAALRPHTTTVRHTYRTVSQLVPS